MAVFNGRNYTLADFLPWNYTEIWDQFWDDVLIEFGLRTAAVGAAVVATSTTNTVTIGAGSKTLTVETGKGFSAGMWVVATDATNSANSMTGRVTSYDATTGALVLAVAAGDVTGGGTPTSWAVGISGKTGPAGPAFAGGILTSALQAIAGTLGAPGLQFGEASSGIYRVSAGVWAAVAGGIEAFRVAATGAVLFYKAVRGQIIALTWGGTITLDANQGNYFSVTLGGATTFANPTNLTAGQPITLIVKQDATGSRTASWGSYWKFPGGTAPTLSTAAGKTDRIVGHIVSATEIHAVAVKGF